MPGNRRRRTTRGGESLIGVAVTVDPDDLAPLEALGKGDAVASVMAMIRTIEALPADMRSALEAEVRAEETAADDTNDAADR
jgi:hypothetical protein